MAHLRKRTHKGTIPQDDGSDDRKLSGHGLAYRKHEQRKYQRDEEEEEGKKRNRCPAACDEHEGRQMHQEGT